MTGSDTFEPLVSLIIGILLNASPADKTRAMKILVACGPAARAAVPVLIRLIEDPSDVVRLAATNVLGELGPLADGAVDVLGSLVQQRQPSGEDLMRPAALALARIATRAAIDKLESAIGDLDPKRSSIALESLARSGPAGSTAVPTILCLLRNPGLHNHLKVISALSGIGTGAAAAVPQIIREIEVGKAEQRDSCVYALGRIGNNSRMAFTKLLECLNSSRGQPRTLAAEAISRLIQKSTIRPAWVAVAMRQLLRNKNLILVDTGLQALRYLPPSPATARALRRLLRRHRNPSVRRWAAFALGDPKWGSTATINALAAALRDPSRGVRGGAATGLSVIGPPAKSALPRLRRAFNDGRLDLDYLNPEDILKRITGDNDAIQLEPQRASHSQP